jgi:hypothetical protein
VSIPCFLRVKQVLTCSRNDEISKTVLTMPDTVAPRPPRRVNYCLNCIKKLSNAVKGACQVETTVFCACDNANAKCNPYREDSGNHNCDDIPAEFNCALNVLVHLQQQTILPRDAAGKLCREERVRDYAMKLKDAVAGWNKAATAALKKDKDWLSHRRESYEQNMKRYEKGLGATSKLTPANQEVDQDLESKFYHT